MKNKRGPWGSIKSAVALMAMKQPVFVADWRQRKGYYDAAKRMGLKVQINQIGRSGTKGLNGFVVTVIE
jgi:hypothetical protein